MAKSFNMTVSELQEKLVKLIASNDIKARIDSHNKVYIKLIKIIILITWIIRIIIHKINK